MRYNGKRIAFYVLIEKSPDIENRAATVVMNCDKHKYQEYCLLGCYVKWNDVWEEDVASIITVTVIGELGT
jgi:hypothetical protein